jgi:hypothetical protein
MDARSEPGLNDPKWRCFPTRSASSAGRSRDSLPATPIVYAARSGVVFHEIAHHFGISDEQLIELDRY